MTLLISWNHLALLVFLSFHIMHDISEALMTPSLSSSSLSPITQAFTIRTFLQNLQIDKSSYIANSRNTSSRMICTRLYASPPSQKRIARRDLKKVSVDNDDLQYAGT